MFIPWAENSRPRKQVQRPGGRSSLGLLEERREGGLVEL